MPETIRMYRFLPSKWALKAIQDRRLKISRLKELNDPFEFHIGVNGANDDHQKIGKDAINSYFDRLNDKFGLICFSRRVTDPVIWSHYSQGHQGIALELEMEQPDNEYFDVEYNGELPILDVEELIRRERDQAYTYSILKQSFGRKSPSWDYEAECRLHCDLQSDDCFKDGDHYFTKITDHFQVKRVILGVRCPISKSDVHKSLAQGGFTGVEVIQAHKSETSYEIVCN